MSAHDTLGDFLTLLRNASRAHKETAETFHSNSREGILRILKEGGYIRDYQVVQPEGSFKRLRIEMKYVNDVPSLTDIQRASKPGRRRYCGSREVPKVLGGMGNSILTTPKGILNEREARRLKVGGELICTVW
ncbi:MAG: 30S ribosomal protein S8 [Opitutales bacterium]|nr:30S ribosomal protein S8 [Opitutales bacterium]